MNRLHRALDRVRREPLAMRGAIAAAITAVVHVAVVAGALDVDDEQTVAGIVDALGMAAGLIWGRRAVTPVADPRDDTGQPLAPETG